MRLATGVVERFFVRCLLSIAASYAMPWLQKRGSGLLFSVLASTVGQSTEPIDTKTEKRRPDPKLTPIPQASHHVPAWFHSQDVVMCSNVLEKCGILSLAVRA